MEYFSSSMVDSMPLLSTFLMSSERKNTTKFRTNTFGFYTFNGKGTVNTYANSKRKSVMNFKRDIRYGNPISRNIVIPNNFSAHRTENVALIAEILDIELVILQSYSPQLIPIEIIRKSIKKVVSHTFVKDQEMIVETVKTNFIEFLKSKSFCKHRVEVFVI